MCVCVCHWSDACLCMRGCVCAWCVWVRASSCAHVCVWVRACVRVWVCVVVSFRVCVYVCVPPARGRRYSTPASPLRTRRTRTYMDTHKRTHSHERSTRAAGTHINQTHNLTGNADAHSHPGKNARAHTRTLTNSLAYTNTHTHTHTHKRTHTHTH